MLGSGGAVRCEGEGRRRLAIARAARGRAAHLGRFLGKLVPRLDRRAHVRLRHEEPVVREPLQRLAAREVREVLAGAPDERALRARHVNVLRKLLAHPVHVVHLDALRAHAENHRRLLHRPLHLIDDLCLFLDDVRGGHAHAGRASGRRRRRGQADLQPRGEAAQRRAEQAGPHVLRCCVLSCARSDLRTSGRSPARRRPCAFMFSAVSLRFFQVCMHASPGPDLARPPTPRALRTPRSHHEPASPPLALDVRARRLNATHRLSPSRRLPPSWWRSRPPPSR